jgi:hypothetical protein
MTLAQQRLAGLQRLDPPWRGVDRVMQLYRLLEAHVPDEIRGLQQEGHLALGEIGGPINAYAEALPDSDSAYAVVITSGFLEFMCAVLRPLCAYSTVHGTNVVQVPALTHAETKERIKATARVFKEWQTCVTMADVERLRSLPVSRVHADLAHKLAVNVELFVLAHELAHVEIFRGLRRSDASLQDEQHLQEGGADLLAVTTLARAGEQLGYRMAFAGAVLGPRILVCLERLGCRFNGPHPAPAERLAMAKIQLRRLCATDLDYIHCSTIACAYDELMEGVESSIFKNTTETEQTYERVLTRAWAILEEGLRDRVADFAAEFAASFLPETAQTFGKAAETLGEWLRAASATPGPGQLDLAKRSGIVALLRREIPGMPDYLRRPLADAIR